MFWKKKEKKTISNPAVEITEANYMDKVINTDKPVLLDFWAPWCGPCKVMGPIIDELADDYGDRAMIGKINTEQQQKLAAMYKIRSIPTLVVIKNKEIVEQYSGVVPKPNLEEIIKNYLD
jgi:thioredoxin 1